MLAQCACQQYALLLTSTAYLQIDEFSQDSECGSQRYARHGVLLSNDERDRDGGGNGKANDLESVDAVGLHPAPSWSPKCRLLQSILAARASARQQRRPSDPAEDAVDTGPG